MKNISFEDLPKAVGLLIQKTEFIEQALLESINSQSQNTEELLTIQQAAKLLHLSVPTLYSKHSRGELPGVSKRGKRLYFCKSSLLKWARQGTLKSNQEIKDSANSFLK